MKITKIILQNRLSDPLIKTSKLCKSCIILSRQNYEKFEDQSTNLYDCTEPENSMTHFLNCQHEKD